MQLRSFLSLLVLYRIQVLDMFAPRSLQLSRHFPSCFTGPKLLKLHCSSLKQNMCIKLSVFVIVYNNLNLKSLKIIKLLSACWWKSWFVVGLWKNCSKLDKVGTLAYKTVLRENIERKIAYSKQGKSKYRTVKHSHLNDA